MRAPLWLLAGLLTVALAGCLAPSHGPQALQPSQAPAEVSERTPLAAGESTAGTEADVLCLFGGGPRLSRGDGRVLPGRNAIELWARIDATFTPMQLGWALDHDARGNADAEGIAWLDPPVGPGAEQRWRIEVEHGQWEAHGGPERWSFHQRHVVTGEEPCYTGGGSGTKAWLIEAVRVP